MSDAGRSFTDKAIIAAIEPDSQKSNTEHFGDMFKGKGDSAASSMQPQSQKTTTQKISDGLTGGSSSSSSSNEHSHSHMHSHSHSHTHTHSQSHSHMNSTSDSNPMEPSLVQKAKNAMGLGQGVYRA